MKAHIFVTSNGFFTEEVKSQFLNVLSSDLQRAAVITTASIEKHNNRYAQKAKLDFIEMGIQEVDFIDIEYDDPHKLHNYSILYINGGNPFDLLYHLKESGADKVIIELVKKDTLIVGVSAGAMVLGPHIRLVEAFTPKMNNVGLSDLSGLSLYEEVIFPHYDREDLFPAEKSIEERIRDYEKKSRSEVVRLKDCDFLIR